MSENLSLQWESFPNQDYNQLHGRKRFPAIRWLGGGKDDTEEGKQLRDALQAIPGVTEVSSSGQYDLSVQKGRAFSFAEIRPQVEAVVCRFFGVTQCDAAEPIVAATVFDDEESDTRVTDPT